MVETVDAICGRVNDGLDKRLSAETFSAMQLWHDEFGVVFDVVDSQTSHTSLQLCFGRSPVITVTNNTQSDINPCICNALFKTACRQRYSNSSWNASAKNKGVVSRRSLPPPRCTEIIADYSAEIKISIFQSGWKRQRDE